MSLWGCRWRFPPCFSQTAKAKHRTAASILPYPHFPSKPICSHCGVTHVIKKSSEVEGRDLSLQHFYPNPLLPVRGRHLGVDEWTPYQLWGRGSGMRTGSGHFKSTMDVKYVTRVSKATETQSNGTFKQRSLQMLTVKSTLCSAACFITPSLNNHMWVKSLNGLVALNKAG